MKDLDKISFSKEVAETLGVETAIIYELYQSNKITNSKDIESLAESIKKEAPFLKQESIENNINKLVKYNFIKINKKPTNYGIRLAGNTNFDRLKMNSDWQPSKEAIDIMNMSEVSEDFCIKKLQEFKLYYKINPTSINTCRNFSGMSFSQKKCLTLHNDTEVL